MRGEITKDGGLVIWRNGKPEIMKCPHSAMNCGHWCPKFGEPYLARNEIKLTARELRKLLDRKTTVLLGDEDIVEMQNTKIDICDRDVLIFQEFQDLRRKEQS